MAMTEQLTTLTTVIIEDNGVHCASGYGAGNKCDFFIPRVDRWPLIGEFERPYCDKYNRDLKPDGTKLMRCHMCVRDFGHSLVHPGRLTRINAIQDFEDALPGIPEPKQLRAVPSIDDHMAAARNSIAGRVRR